jgi:putative toxin-antitoxin system antitoxin component (TIGR02293 family)
MAATSIGAVAGGAPQGRRAPQKDVFRFRRFLARGSPGAHAYVVLLGLDTFEATDLLRAQRRGFPYRALERLRRNMALPLELVGDLVAIPRRTLARRKRGGRLLPDESDRLLRAARLFGRTLALFEGNRDAASEWLTRPQPALGGAVPIELAASDLGAREVETLVGRLEHGVFS